MGTNEILLTRRQAAELLRVSPQTLANWGAMKKGPKFHRSGNVTLYKLSDIEAWQEETMWIRRY